MICPECRRTYDDTKRFCPEDGTRLVPSDGGEIDDEADMVTMVGDEVRIPSREGGAPEETTVRVVVHYRTPEPGDRIGDYQVVSQIGAGGMADVFHAVHVFTGKPVAIKLLNPRVPAQAEAVGRFVQEARAVQMIGHRNIIDIIDFDQLPDGRHYFVLEYLDGMNLQQYLEQEGPVTLERTIQVLKAVASALDAAHARGIIHRDLKPENIFLERPDRPEHMLVKLLDFGAATLVETERRTSDSEWLKTQDGVTLGTPDYMSPEQCQEEEVDQRTDVYSLGVVAYQMLVGQLPFGTGEPYEVMRRRLLGNPVPPSTAAPHLSPLLDAPLLRALQDDPNKRFESAGALVAALEEVLSRGEPRGDAPPAPSASAKPDDRAPGEAKKSKPAGSPATAAERAGHVSSTTDAGPADVASATPPASGDERHGEGQKARGIKKWLKSLMK